MNKQKKWALAGLAGVLSLGLAVGGATYALFTDNESNTNNARAGTVVLYQERDMGDTIPGPMFYPDSWDPTGAFPYDTNENAPFQPPGGESIGGWAPGDRVTRAMNLYNQGTLDAVVKRVRANVNPAGVTAGPAYNEFINKMNIKVSYPAQNITIYNGPLSGLLNGNVSLNTPFLLRANPSGPANITFEAYLDTSAGNVIQGQTFIFDFTFEAEQRRNNP